MGLYRRSFRLGVPVVVCWAAGAAAHPAHSAQEPAPPVFEADVTLVAVPVFVTDKSGKAVAGLTAEDFEVYDGGRRVPIAAFQAIDVDAPVALASQSELPVAIQAAAPRQFLLLFDLVFSPTAGIARARAAAIRFVRESLGASDLVAVATFGNAGLRVLTNFTSDHAYAARAIEGLGLVDAFKSDPLGLSGEVGASAEGSGQGASLVDQELAAQSALLVAAEKSSQGLTATDFLITVEQLAQKLAPIRGRKQIVLLSAGFPQSMWTGSSTMGDPLRTSASGRANSQQDPMRQRMQALFRTAERSDVTIHSVSLAGLEGPIDVSSWTGRNEGRGEGRNTLAALAKNTGGRFILPTNDFGLAFREVDQISRHYYVLAFESAQPADKYGRPSRLKVRVHGAGRSVSHRSEYVVPPPPSPDSDTVAPTLGAAEAITKGLSGGPLSLHLVALPYRDREGKPSVHAVLHIDSSALAGASRVGPLDVQVYGYAMAAGRVLERMALNITLDPSKAGASPRGDGLRVLTAFAVPPGVVDLRFFVRAGASALSGSIRRSVEVPTFTDAESVLSTPMFTLPPAGRAVVPFQPRNRPQIEAPFHLGSEPFVPDASVALEPGHARDVCVFVWRTRKGTIDPLEVTGEIARPGEAPLPLRIEGVPRVVPDGDGFDRYVVTVVAPQATPGAYALRLTFRDAGTKLTARSETQIVLEN